MRKHALPAAVGAAVLLWGLGGVLPAAQDKAKGAGPLTVIDKDGKEVKLASWTCLNGTRHLSWLAPAPAKGKGDKDKGKDDEGDAAQAPAGPEALELREEGSTTFKEGILTLVPLTAIKKIDYDGDSKTVKVTYLKAGGEEGVLTGTTKYVGINKLTLEGEVDLGELGKAAVKFQGGSAKGIRGIQFPAPKAGAAPTGRPAVVIAREEKTEHKAVGLEPLYVVGRGRLQLLGKLQFKATVKVPLEKLERLRFVKPEEKGAAGLDFELTLKGGQTHTLTLLPDVNPEDGTPARLKGLLGRVEAGYKLFPLHTIEEVRFDGAAAAPADKGKPKKDDI